MSQALNVRHTAADSTARLNAQSNAQVQRYWPGRAPKWAEKDHYEESSESEQEQDKASEDGEPAATTVAAPVVLKRVADPRLARLSVRENDGDVAKPRVISRRQARDDSDEDSGDSAQESSGESEEEDEEVTARRQAVRERLKQRKADEEEVLAEAGEEEEEEEEESEYETDSDDEQVGRQMLKPVFVTKKERETIAEREALEKEEEEAMKREKARLKERAKQTKELVIEQYKQEEEAAKAAKQGPKELGDIDTDDEKDPEAEYELWRIRELRRIRRDREERDALREAEAEKERLRTMTPEERALWERENPKQLNLAPKKSWKFMQKYWHKGAFFQEVSDNPHAAGQQPDSIFTRDFSAATGEDKLNKEILPKIMQVKNFGRRGRTKYTHLLDQDTSVRDDYYTLDGVAGPKKGRRLAGTDQVFEKPKKLNT